jgi:hypothetical protein
MWLAANKWSTAAVACGLHSAGAAPLRFPADRSHVAGKIRTRQECSLSTAYALHDGVRRLHAYRWDEELEIELKEVAQPTTP